MFCVSVFNTSQIGKMTTERKQLLPIPSLNDKNGTGQYYSISHVNEQTVQDGEDHMTGSGNHCHDTPPEKDEDEGNHCHDTPPEKAVGNHCDGTPPEEVVGTHYHGTPPEKTEGSHCHGTPPEKAVGNHYHDIPSEKDVDEGNHCHGTLPEKAADVGARRVLVIASIFCLVFMLAETIGGIFAHSLAILADAAHMLTDFASFMISLLALFLSSRPATKKMSFGWYRAEIIGALVSVLFIWVVTGILVYIAVLRIVENDYEIEAGIMLITAGFGVAVNIVMGLMLHQQGHGHSHHHGNSNHSHDSHSDSHASLESSDKSDIQEKKSKMNINVRAAFIHVLGDLCQSIGVLIASIMIYYKPEWKIADPICTFLFSGLVLITTITILRDILLVLMEGTPRGINFTEVKQSFYQVEGVKEVHNLRVWSLTLNKSALSAHIAVDKSSDPHVILKKASSVVQGRYGITESTIQIEEYVDEMLDCTQCKGPKD